MGLPFPRARGTRPLLNRYGRGKIISLYTDTQTVISFNQNRDLRL